MIYQYEALNRKGERLTGLVDATSETKAKLMLKQDGLYVSKITPKSTAEAEIRQKSSDSTFARIFTGASSFIAKKMAAKQVGIFSRQLATLLSAGMPLLRTINDIMEQTDHQYFKQVVADIKENLENGASFSNCLLKHRGVFSDMYINMVKVGENLGSLDEVIERLADIEEKNVILKSKVQSALWYPGFMIFFSIMIVIFLMVKIVPSLAEMFEDMGHDLPVPTQIVMAISSFLSSFLPLVIILLGLAIFLLYRYVNTDKGRVKFDEFKMNIPVFKVLYNKMIVYRFTQNMGIMLNNNVDILKSFEIVEKIVGNTIIEKKINEAAFKVREGTPVSKALAAADFLPKMVLGMINAGEASDKLDSMLVKIGEVYETEIDLTITSLTNMIEPLIIVFMGGIVGGIVLAVMLPIFQMNLIVQ
ncbi:MAG: type II secretion system F family protein [Spirochaetes bacterium]|jgi:general secretion pathway protein F|nr:type II secretion system F family protein [Spirochaetota bacterium]